MKHENIRTVPLGQRLGSCSPGDCLKWGFQEWVLLGWYHFGGHRSTQSPWAPWRICAIPFIYEWIELPQSTCILASTTSSANGFQKCICFPLLKLCLPFIYSMFTALKHLVFVCWTALSLSSPPHCDLINWYYPNTASSFQWDIFLSETIFLQLSLLPLLPQFLRL